MNSNAQDAREGRERLLVLSSLVMAAAAMFIFIVTLLLPLISAGRERDTSLGTDTGQSGDITAPIIVGAKNITVYKGEAVAYRKGVTVKDDGGDDKVTLTVDSSRVDTSTPGTYSATYTAIDPVGNRTSVTIFVFVLGISIDTMNAELDKIISAIITPGMSKEDMCRKVYDYVKSHIAYSGTSEKSEWRYEAYRVLFGTGSDAGAGDCFSFFAAAKAFLERLGIENLDIERTPGLVDETHYWSLVNIGEGEEARWYHFDATRLRAEYNHSGCLLTERQIVAYGYIREHFYAYDKTGYPAASEEIITPTPELEPYY